MSAEVTISASREALVYCDGMDVAHVLTSPLWGPQGLGFVERRVLIARLRAIADLIEIETLMPTALTAPASSAAGGADGGAR